ncbi:MAG TPA: alpha/beta hydrolase, partial [Thermoanaerobaculia bacterium]|nr:alpha/beta hydrolase [Thermoanaerobaculia bacterium]
PMILLHGPGEYAAKWMRVIPELAKEYRVIAPDLPGHGASEPMTGEFDVSHILAWLDDLIEETCEEAPTLVGQVVGGAIAARFALENGERLRHLVLVDALGLTDFRPAPEFGAALERFVGDPSEATHEELWQRCAHDLDRLRKGLGERWDEIKAYNLDRARAPELRATQQRLMMLFGLSAISDEDLGCMNVPTTLIWGRHDLATAVSVAEAASARYGWPLHVIENAADDPPLEQPEAFLRALRRAEAALGDEAASADNNFGSSMP